MKKTGKLRTLSSSEITDSRVSIGFECLDRGLFNPEKCYDLLAKSGVKHARCQTGWAKCEKTKGIYDFKWLDSIVDELLLHGIRPWFNVGFGNPLYMPDVPNETAVGCVPLYYGEEALLAWENYVKALTLHFKDRISYYEIWNEPTIPQFWYPKAPNGAEYARLVNLTASIIKETSQNARTIANISQIYFFEFLEDMLKHTDKDSIDVLTYHAYSTIPEYRYASGVRQLRKLLDNNGFSHVELWQGEGGYPSWAYKGHWLVKEGCNNERAQAIWQLRRYFLDIANHAGRSSFFQMADMWEKPYAKAVEVIDKPAAQGILNGITYTPKQSYHTLTSLATLFSGSIVPSEEYIQVSYQADSTLSLLSCVSMSYERNGMPVYAYYLPTDVRDNLTEKRYLASVTIYGKISSPVLIDPYTQDVYAIEGITTSQGLTEYRNLSLMDYPLIITDRTTYQ